MNDNASPTGKRAPLIVILVVLIIVGVVGFITFFASKALDNAGSKSPEQPQAANDPILGDGGHFDPISAYPSMAKYAGDGLQLTSMDIYYVRSDGTLDLYAKYKPYVYYFFFQQMDAPPPDAPPVGAGGKLNEKWYQPVDVDVRGPNNPGEKLRLNRYDGKPMNTTQRAISAPTCSLRTLWSAALEKGAPPNAVATIYYDARGYSFRISDTSVRLDFNPQCHFTGGTGLTPQPTETRAPTPVSAVVDNS